MRQQQAPCFSLTPPPDILTATRSNRFSSAYSASFFLFFSIYANPIVALTVANKLFTLCFSVILFSADLAVTEWSGAFSFHCVEAGVRIAANVRCSRYRGCTWVISKTTAANELAYVTLAVATASDCGTPLCRAATFSTRVVAGSFG